MSLKKTYSASGKAARSPMLPQGAEKKKPFWSTEKIMSTSAIMISLMSLIALFYQTNLMREEQELQRTAQLKSTMPYLMIANANYGGPDYSIVLSNKGIGPAIIDSTTVIYKDSAYQMDFPTFFYQEIPEMDKIEHLYHSNILPGQLIPPGETIEIFKVNDSQESTNQFIRLLEKHEFDYQIIYRSVYDERWALGAGRRYLFSGKDGGVTKEGSAVQQSLSLITNHNLMK
jgi:hypothetical protein